jgi:trimethylamine--corrinoid protein Co-methyltransferase
MPLSSISPHAPIFQLFTQDGIEKIQKTVSKTLSEIGVEFHHEGALEIFKKGGAVVEGQTVRIPEGLLKDSLAETPSTFTFFSRDGEPHMKMGGYEVHYGTTGTNPYWLNPYTNQRELSTRQTIRYFARLCDYLPSMEWSMPLGVPSDAPVQVADRYQFFEAVTNNSKTLYSSCYTSEGMEDVVEMAAVIAGGKEELRQKPFFTTGINPGSPLTLDYEVTGKLIVMSKAGLPILFNPMPMAGATAPSTMAGVIVIALAEGFAGLVLAQLVRPGTPIVTGGVLSPMDMNTTINTYGSPEFTLMMSGISEVLRHYKIPSYGTAGCSNAKVVDSQAALEMMQSLLVCTLAGSNMIHNLGLVDTGMTANLQAHVLGDEVAAIVRRIAGGIEVSEETLAYDVIKSVGPKGHFLGEEHTLRHFKENHYSKLIDRRKWEIWFEDGAKRMEERLTEKVFWILENHEPPPLPEDVVQELERMLSRAEKTA